MNTPGDAIAFAVTSSQNMIHLFTDDLSGADWLHRPVPKANCAAWIIGHLVLSDRAGLTRLGENDLPPLPDGFQQRFGRDADAPRAADFGDTSMLMPLFDKHRTLISQTVKNLGPDHLNKPLEKPHPRFKTLGEVAMFFGCVHPMLHAGHLSLIRRSLGRPPVI